MSRKQIECQTEEQPSLKYFGGLGGEIQKRLIEGETYIGNGGAFI